MQAAPSSNLTRLLALPAEGLAAFIEGDSSAAGAGGSQGLWVLTVVDTAADKGSRWVGLGLVLSLTSPWPVWLAALGIEGRWLLCARKAASAA